MLNIIQAVHVGLGNDSRAKAMTSHRGRDVTQDLSSMK